MRVLGLACVTVVIAGCGGGGDSGGGPGPQTPVASVVITPSSAQNVAICGTQSFSAQPKDAQNNNLTRTVNWTSTGGILSLSGTSGSQITATGVAAGAGEVRATSEQQSASVNVTVPAAQPSASAQVAATAANTFSPRCVHVSAGATVTWTFETLHNAMFDTNPTGGDIPDQASGTASRSFPTAGTYRYTCTLHQNMNGIVVVQ